MRHSFHRRVRVLLSTFVSVAQQFLHGVNTPQYITGMQQYDVFLHIWKKAEITTYHKPGKGTSFPENPHPVSCRQTLVKLLEILALSLLQHLKFLQICKPLQFI
jgi:hypothetical protein